jgi:FtsP/CotA-like multicopper oxidase with cupredoxin domain
LNIAPGERYDIEFVANNPGTWLLAEQSENPETPTLAIPIVYEGVEGETSPVNEQLPVLTSLNTAKQRNRSFL